MELILKETISSLGQEGDIVKVKPGFGRNYLLPKGKAVIATEENKAQLEENRAVIEARLAEQRKTAEAVAKKLSGISLEISELASDDDRLFGSVTSSDINEKLAKLGVEIEKRQIVLTDPIKNLGDFAIPIKIGFDIVVDIQVKVVAQVTGD